MKVAIVYDRVNKWGGAERVLLALHEIFPSAPLYTSVYDEKNAKWAKAFPEVRTSFLQMFPIKSTHELFGWLMPFAFNSFNFDKFDLVISVTSEAAKGIKTNIGTLHICYCLTPTRYLWSSHDDYFKNPPPVFKIFPFFWTISRPFVFFLRKWDVIASKQPNHLIAISTEVKKRIKKYYNRDSRIIFPPADSVLHGTVSKTKKYFLIVSRLVGYKRVDLAVKSFNKLGHQLIIVGSGREMGRLRKIANKNIKFVGHVSEKQLAKYYASAKALIMPQEEDFGIVAVEAQSRGVPVIALKKGGVLDTVIHGKTGILFKEQSVDGLIRAIKEFEKSKFNHNAILKNAKKFSKKRFQKEFLDLVKKMLH